ncbi:MAG: PPC domain-containing protein [Anaerolineae bacterium]|nr:PPC domain-containing protein [Anaerolineae bacterium]
MPGVAALAQGDSTPISAGIPVEGEITADQSEVFYTLEGAAGDVIAISMTAISQGLDSYLELLLPDGSIAVSDDDSGGSLNALIGPYTLPEDGTYTIRATRFGNFEGGSSGRFSLLVSAVVPQALVSGEGVTVDLNAEEPFAFFTFDGAQAGLIYELAADPQPVADATGFSVIVRGSTGMAIHQGYGQPGSLSVISPLSFQPGEQYAVTIVRQQEGPIAIPDASARLILTLNEVQAGAISLGDTVTGTLNGAAPNAYYQFSGEAGDLLRLEGSHTSSALALDVQITGPSGSYTGGFSTAYTPYESASDEASADPIVLTESGTHLLVIRMFDPQTGLPGASDSSDDFSVTLSETQTPFLTPGEAQTGTVMFNGQGQTYRFMGSEGQQLRITLAGLDEVYTPALEVQGPGDPVLTQGHMAFLLNANSAIPGSASFELTLPKDGLYLLNVRMGGGYAPEAPPQDAPGEYSLLIEMLP